MDVAVHADRLGRCQFGSGRRGGGFVQVGEHEPRALGGQPLGHRPPDAVTGTGDQRHPSAEATTQSVVHRDQRTSPGR